MAVTLTRSNLFNSFAVFREILTGVSAFTTIFPGAHFENNDRYFEDFPNPKADRFVGYPLIVIETDMDDSHVSYTGMKKMSYSTKVTIYTDYSIERATPRLSSYLNAVANYFNLNQTSLLRSYGLDGIRITKSRDRDVINEREVVVGTLTFDYEVYLDVEN